MFAWKISKKISGIHTEEVVYNKYSVREHLEDFLSFRSLPFGSTFTVEYTDDAGYWIENGPGFQGTHTALVG